MDNKFKHYLKLILSPAYFPPLITLTFLLIGTLAIFALVRDQAVTVNMSNLHLRATASTNAESLGVLTNGETYVILQEENGWYKIRMDAKTDGWIPIWAIDNDALDSDENIALYTLVKTSLYKEANEDSQVLATIPKDRYVDVSYESKGWLAVSYDGNQGYVQTRAVNLLAQADVPDIDPRDLEDEYDPQAIEQAKQEAEEIVVVRYSGEPFFNAPSFDALANYNMAYGQKFKYLGEVESPDYPGTYFMHVEDSEGLQGYVESRISAMEADSIGHVTGMTASSIQKAVIMLDAGHGGSDGGGESNDGSILEKNLTLQTSNLLKQKLEAVGATVLMTRTDDEFVELADRAKLSNENQVDAFISVHYDRGGDGWRGTTTYYFHDQDYELANKVNAAIATLQMPNNGTLFGNYQVIRENTRQAILLELGYMSSPEDVALITSQAYQDALTDVITTALVEYFGNE